MNGLRKTNFGDCKRFLSLKGSLGLLMLTYGPLIAFVESWTGKIVGHIPVV